MLHLTQTPFLQALGFAIINSLWQFALLWLIYVTLQTFLKISSCKKYAAGLLLQAAGFSWFAATFTFYLLRFSQLQETYIQEKNFYSASAANSTMVSENFFAAITKAETGLPYLAVVYLLILLFLSFKLIGTYNSTKLIKTTGLQKIEVNWRLFVKNLSGQLGIKREVKIYLSELVQTPLTIGFLKPFILIPLASLNQLTNDQMEAVILHELAHIKRFDYLFNIFLALIEVTLFFNPFMLLISRHIKRERENCCDDWVLQYQYNPASYAHALLQIATCQSSSLLTLGAADNKKVLLTRIKRMLEKKEKTFFNYKYQLIAFLVIFTVLGSLAILSSRHPINNAAVAPLPGQLIAKPMIEIVNSSLHNPDFFVAPAEKKATPDEKHFQIKTEKKNIFYKSPLKIAFNHTNKNNRKQQPETPVAEEVNPVSFDQNALFAADAEKNIEASGTALDEAKFLVADAKKQEVTLAEDQLKYLVKYLLEANKTLVNQKQIIAAIKAAFEQLKTIKIQLNETAQVNSLDDNSTALIKLNELEIKPQSAPYNLFKLQAITKELKMQTERALQQKNRQPEKNCRYYYDLKMPEMMQHVFLQEKLHSFSFECPAEPKTEVAELHSLFSQKRGKKINNTLKEDNDKDLHFENKIPFIIERSGPKASAKKNSFLIIRI